MGHVQRAIRADVQRLRLRRVGHRQAVEQRQAIHGRLADVQVEHIGRGVTPRREGRRRGTRANTDDVGLGDARARVRPIDRRQADAGEALHQQRGALIHDQLHRVRINVDLAGVHDRHVVGPRIRVRRVAGGTHVRTARVQVNAAHRTRIHTRRVIGAPRQHAFAQAGLIDRVAQPIGPDLGPQQIHRAVVGQLHVVGLRSRIPTTVIDAEAKRVVQPGSAAARCTPTAGAVAHTQLEVMPAGRERYRAGRHVIPVGVAQDDRVVDLQPGTIIDTLGEGFRERARVRGREHGVAGIGNAAGRMDDGTICRHRVARRGAEGHRGRGRIRLAVARIEAQGGTLADRGRRHGPLVGTQPDIRRGAGLQGADVVQLGRLRQVVPEVDRAAIQDVDVDLIARRIHIDTAAERDRPAEVDRGVVADHRRIHVERLGHRLADRRIQRRRHAEVQVAAGHRLHRRTVMQEEVAADEAVHRVTAVDDRSHTVGRGRDEALIAGPRERGAAVHLDAFQVLAGHGRGVMGVTGLKDPGIRRGAKAGGRTRAGRQRTCLNDPERMEGLAGVGIVLLVGRHQVAAAHLLDVRRRAVDHAVGIGEDGRRDRRPVFRRRTVQALRQPQGGSRRVIEDIRIARARQRQRADEAVLSRIDVHRQGRVLPGQARGPSDADMRSGRGGRRCAIDEGAEQDRATGQHRADLLVIQRRGRQLDRGEVQGGARADAEGIRRLVVERVGHIGVAQTRRQGHTVADREDAGAVALDGRVAGRQYAVGARRLHASQAGLRVAHKRQQRRHAERGVRAQADPALVAHRHVAVIRTRSRVRQFQRAGPDDVQITNPSVTDRREIRNRQRTARDLRTEAAQATAVIVGRVTIGRRRSHHDPVRTDLHEVHHGGQLVDQRTVVQDRGTGTRAADDVRQADTAPEEGRRHRLRDVAARVRKTAAQPRVRILELELVDRHARVVQVDRAALVHVNPVGTAHRVRGADDQVAVYVGVTGVRIDPVQADRAHRERPVRPHLVADQHARRRARHIAQGRADRERRAAAAELIPVRRVVIVERIQTQVGRQRAAERRISDRTQRPGTVRGRIVIIEAERGRIVVLREGDDTLRGRSHFVVEVVRHVDRVEAARIDRDARRRRRRVAHDNRAAAGQVRTQSQAADHVGGRSRQLQPARAQLVDLPAAGDVTIEGHRARRAVHRPGTIRRHQQVARERQGLAVRAELADVAVGQGATGRHVVMGRQITAVEDDPNRGAGVEVQRRAKAHVHDMPRAKVEAARMDFEPRGAAAEQRHIAGAQTRRAVNLRHATRDQRAVRVIIRAAEGHVAVDDHIAGAGDDRRRRTVNRQQVARAAAERHGGERALERADDARHVAGERGADHRVIPIQRQRAVVALHVDVDRRRDIANRVVVVGHQGDAGARLHRRRRREERVIDTHHEPTGLRARSRGVLPHRHRGVQRRENRQHAVGLHVEAVRHVDDRAGIEHRLAAHQVRRNVILQQHRQGRQAAQEVHFLATAERKVAELRTAHVRRTDDVPELDSPARRRRILERGRAQQRQVGLDRRVVERQHPDARAVGHNNIIEVTHARRAGGRVAIRRQRAHHVVYIDKAVEHVDELLRANRRLVDAEGRLAIGVLVDRQVVAPARNARRARLAVEEGDVAGPRGRLVDRTPVTRIDHHFETAGARNRHGAARADQRIGARNERVVIQHHRATRHKEITRDVADHVSTAEAVADRHRAATRRRHVVDPEHRVIGAAHDEGAGAGAAGRHIRSGPDEGADPAAADRERGTIAEVQVVQHAIGNRRARRTALNLEVVAGAAVEHTDCRANFVDLRAGRRRLVNEDAQRAVAVQGDVRAREHRRAAGVLMPEVQVQRPAVGRQRAGARIHVDLGNAARHGRRVAIQRELPRGPRDANRIQVRVGVRRTRVVDQHVVGVQIAHEAHLVHVVRAAHRHDTRAGDIADKGVAARTRKGRGVDRIHHVVQVQDVHVDDVGVAVGRHVGDDPRVVIGVQGQCAAAAKNHVGELDHTGLAGHGAAIGLHRPGHARRDAERIGDLVQERRREGPHFIHHAAEADAVVGRILRRHRSEQTAVRAPTRGAVDARVALLERQDAKRIPGAGVNGTEDGAIARVECLRVERRGEGCRVATLQIEANAGGRPIAAHVSATIADADLDIMPAGRERIRGLREGVVRGHTQPPRAIDLDAEAIVHITGPGDITRARHVELAVVDPLRVLCPDSATTKNRGDARTRPGLNAATVGGNRREVANRARKHAAVRQARRRQRHGIRDIALQRNGAATRRGLRDALLEDQRAVRDRRATVVRPHLAQGQLAVERGRVEHVTRPDDRAVQKERAVGVVQHGTVANRDRRRIDLERHVVRHGREHAGDGGKALDRGVRIHRPVDDKGVRVIGMANAAHTAQSTGTGHGHRRSAAGNRLGLEAAAGHRERAEDGLTRAAVHLNLVRTDDGRRGGAIGHLHRQRPATHARITRHLEDMRGGGRTPPVHIGERGAGAQRHYRARPLYLEDRVTGAGIAKFHRQQIAAAGEDRGFAAVQANDAHGRPIDERTDGAPALAITAVSAGRAGADRGIDQAVDHQVRGGRTEDRAVSLKRFVGRQRERRGRGHERRILQVDRVVHRRRLRRLDPRHRAAVEDHAAAAVHGVGTREVRRNRGAIRSHKLNTRARVIHHKRRAVDHDGGARTVEFQLGRPESTHAARARRLRINRDAARREGVRSRRREVRRLQVHRVAIADADPDSARVRVGHKQAQEGQLRGGRGLVRRVELHAGRAHIVHVRGGVVQLAPTLHGVHVDRIEVERAHGSVIHHDGTAARRHFDTAVRMRRADRNARPLVLNILAGHVRLQNQAAGVAEGATGDDQVAAKGAQDPVAVAAGMFEVAAEGQVTGGDAIEAATVGQRHQREVGRRQRHGRRSVIPDDAARAIGRHRRGQIDGYLALGRIGAGADIDTATGERAHRAADRRGVRRAGRPALDVDTAARAGRGDHAVGAQIDELAVQVVAKAEHAAGRGGPPPVCHAGVRIHAAVEIQRAAGHRGGLRERRHEVDRRRAAADIQPVGRQGRGGGEVHGAELAGDNEVTGRRVNRRAVLEVDPAVVHRQAAHHHAAEHLQPAGARQGKRAAGGIAHALEVHTVVAVLEGVNRAGAAVQRHHHVEVGPVGLRRQNRRAALQDDVLEEDLAINRPRHRTPVGLEIERLVRPNVHHLRQNVVHDRRHAGRHLIHTASHRAAVGKEDRRTRVYAVAAAGLTGEDIQASGRRGDIEHARARINVDHHRPAHNAQHVAAEVERLVDAVDVQGIQDHRCTRFINLNHRRTQQADHANRVHAGAYP